MIMDGKPTSFKSRHINIRYYHTKEMVDSGDIVIEYCHNELIRADVNWDYSYQNLLEDTIEDLKNKMNA
jgi:hypothetical protein